MTGVQTCALPISPEGYSGQPAWLLRLEQEKKRVLTELLEKAKAEKPELSQSGVNDFVRSQYPFWTKNKINDYGKSLFFMITEYLKEKKKQASAHESAPVA